MTFATDVSATHITKWECRPPRPGAHFIVLRATWDLTTEPPTRVIHEWKAAT